MAQISQIFSTSKDSKEMNLLLLPCNWGEKLSANWLLGFQLFAEQGVNITAAMGIEAGVTRDRFLSPRSDTLKSQGDGSGDPLSNS
jgi:hypothetical protein